MREKRLRGSYLLAILRKEFPPAEPDARAMIHGTAENAASRSMNQYAATLPVA
jgi:hypothetical protein